MMMPAMADLVQPGNGSRNSFACWAPAAASATTHSTALERTMQSQGVTWTDFGDVIEHCGDNDKYTEAEMHEFARPPAWPVSRQE